MLLGIFYSAVRHPAGEESQVWKQSEMISCGVSGVDAMEVLKSEAYLSFERTCLRIKHLVGSKRPVHYE